MKQFLKYLVSWFLIVILILEATLRIFVLAAKTVPAQNLDGNYLLVSDDSGYWVRGGLGEITNYYEINKQGFNSIVDYDKLDSNNINVALIGDSYIEGFQTDVRNSIGRQLEKILEPNIRVHEFGRAGANIVDFALIYKDFIQNRDYDFVFVLATDKDLMDDKSSFMGRGKRVSKESLSRKIYDNIHTLRYLNINHGLGVSFIKLINNGPESIERIHFKKDTTSKVSEDSFLKELNKDALNSIPESIIFLHETDKLNKHFIENFDFEFKKIIHEKLPKDHGFDGHWNANGRFNCANAMADYIKSKIETN